MAKRTTASPNDLTDETNPRLESVESEEARLQAMADRYRESRKRDLATTPGDVLNAEPGWEYAAHEVYADAKGPDLARITNTREKWHRRGYEFVTGPVSIDSKYARAPGQRAERYPNNEYMEVWRVHQTIADLHQRDLNADFERAMAVFAEQVRKDAPKTQFQPL